MIVRGVKRVARIALAVLAVLLMGALVSQAFSYLGTRARIEKALALKSEIAPPESSDVQGRDLSAFDELANAGIFGVPPRREAQAPRLSGLMGNYAILNGNMAAVGDDVDGWKVAEIQDLKVIVTRDERREELSMYETRSNLDIDNRPREQRGNQPPNAFPSPGESGGGSGGSGRGSGDPDRAPGESGRGRATAPAEGPPPDSPAESGERREEGEGPAAAPGDVEESAPQPETARGERGARGIMRGDLSSVSDEDLSRILERMGNPSLEQLEPFLSNLPAETAEQIRDRVRRIQETGQ